MNWQPLTTIGMASGANSKMVAGLLTDGVGEPFRSSYFPIRKRR